jgi:tetratricopeptide (TPR) repeat protein
MTDRRSPIKKGAKTKRPHAVQRSAFATREAAARSSEHAGLLGLAIKKYEEALAKANPRERELNEAWVGRHVARLTEHCDRSRDSDEARIWILFDGADVPQTALRSAKRQLLSIARHAKKALKPYVVAWNGVANSLVAARPAQLEITRSEKGGASSRQLKSVALRMARSLDALVWLPKADVLCAAHGEVFYPLEPRDVATHSHPNEEAEDYLYLAVAYFEMGLDADAMAACRHALSLDPDYDLAGLWLKRISGTLS